jgi:hypothetical protein
MNVLLQRALQWLGGTALRLVAVLLKGRASVLRRLGVGQLGCGVKERLVVIEIAILIAIRAQPCAHAAGAGHGTSRRFEVL